jgi:hypothetical protein
MPGDGWSISGAGGITSGAGVSGWLGEVGAGTSVGGVVAIKMFLSRH